MLRRPTRTQRFRVMEPFDYPSKKRHALCAFEVDASPWQPAMDVYRSRGGWICKFDLAGVGPDEIEVQVCQRTLVLSGVRRDRQVSEGLRCHALEITYSRFARAVELPCDLERATISCEFRDGMLLVTIQVPQDET